MDEFFLSKNTLETIHIWTLMLNYQHHVNFSIIYSNRCFKMETVNRTSQMLVLSSGGQRAPYMEGFLQRVRYKEWDYVFGISAGAMLGAFVVQATQDNFATGFKKLMENHIDIVKPHNILGGIFNFASAFLWHDSIYKPCLKTMIETMWKNECEHTNLSVGAYCVTDGKYTTFLNPKIEMIVASASIPVVFPSVTIDKKEYVDGALAHVFPIEEIKANYECGNLYVMLCYPTNHDMYKKCMGTNKHNLLGRVYNTLNESTWTNMNRDLDDLADFLGLDNMKIRTSGKFKIPNKGTLFMFIPTEECYIDLSCKNYHKIATMQKHGFDVASGVMGGGYK